MGTPSPSGTRSPTESDGRGLVYPCRFDSDATEPCEIVDRRTRNGKEEVYVHFVNHDRRLDRWVDATDVDFAQGQPRKEVESADATLVSSARPTTRKQRRRFEAENHVHGVENGIPFEDMDPETHKLEEKRMEATKVRNLDAILLGKYLIDAWYYSPYPDAATARRKLYVCEYTLKYFTSFEQFSAHKRMNKWRHPPGDEIYRKDCISVYEVDGAQCKLYSQNLCLLGKLFLDHKTLYFDVDQFLFYVMCEYDQDGAHIVGFFSKEKYCPSDFNLACICVLPPHQRKGYGKFLIAFSYELSKREGRPGTPERPLSDLGLLSYRSFWRYTILTFLREHNLNVSVSSISEELAIKFEDVIHTLKSLNMLSFYHGSHSICVAPKQVQEHLESLKMNWLPLDPHCLSWEPDPEIERKRRKLDKFCYR